MEPANKSACDLSITLPLGMCCQKCRRPGDDIRLVNYPILFTLFTFQFRFEFKGHWCHLHRTLRLLLASFLTATLGWFGFPFCIVATPKLLFGLASGAGIHKGNNARMLRSQADLRKDRGDLEGATRCLENSFFYLDDLWGRQELRSLYELRPADAGTSSRKPVAVILLPVLLLLAALLLGNLVGLADVFWMELINLSRFPLLDVLVGWLALSGLGVPAVLLLREWIQRVLERDRQPHPVFGLALGLSVGALLLMGVFAGRALGNFASVLWNNSTSLPTVDLLAAIGAGLTRGWLLEIYRFANLQDSWRIVHLAYIILLGIYALYTGAFAAWEIRRWQSRLVEIRGTGEVEKPRLAPGWVGLIAVLLLVGLSSNFVPQTARVDLVEARDAFNAGVALEYAQRYDEAIQRFEDAVRLDPYMAEAYEELSWVYYQKGDAPRAIIQSLRSIEVNPDRASPHYSLGNIYYFEDDNEKAFSEFEKAIVLNPGYYEAYIGSGWAAYALGDLTKAELSFLKALDHHPRPYDAYIGLGKIYEDRGKTAQAIETYQKANQTDITSATADVYLGLAYQQQNELDQAIKYLKNAVIKDPSNRMAHTYLLMSYLNAGQFEDALKLSTAVVERYPQRAGLRALFATALLLSGQPEEAHLQIDQVLAIPEKSDLDAMLLIQALMRFGRYADAEREANRALAANPAKTDFYIDLSAARLSQGDDRGALQACDQAELAGVNAVDVALQRAWIYLSVGDLDQSLEQIQHAQSLGADSAAAHNLLGRIYYELDDLEKSLQETSQAIALNPYNVDGYINLGFVLLETGNGLDAIKAGAQAARLSPELDVPHFILGMGYLNTGQDSAAVNELNQYLQKSQANEATRLMRDQAESALQSLRTIY